MLTTTDALLDVERRIRTEFRQMPGLRLTKPQFRRLYGLDAVSCDLVLAGLIDRHVLATASDGRFGTADETEPALR